ncbi:hypothetical protein [Streptomyces sulfonofaciens]
MYTHGLLVIVSTKQRYGGFARSVGTRVPTTPHGLGYAATVIVVDEDVDPFNLNQVMWALSTKMNPAHDLIHLPNMPVMPLAPQTSTPGVLDALVIDATTPVERDRRPNHSDQVRDLPETGEWRTRLQRLAAARCPERTSRPGRPHDLPPLRLGNRRETCSPRRCPVRGTSSSANGACTRGGPANRHAAPNVNTSRRSAA